MDEEMKPWWQSKTVWVNILTLILGVVTALAGSEVLPSDVVVILTSVVVPVINVFLRWLTDKPITSVIKSLDMFRGK